MELKKLRSKLPLCEKYRPKKLDDIVGQKRAASTVREMLNEKNIQHLLFLGPPGVGKSIPQEEYVIVKIDGEVEIVPIGSIPGNAKLEVPSWDGRVVEWKKAILIRHQYNGELIKIRTKHGFSAVATPDHSFIIRTKNKIKTVSFTKKYDFVEVPIINDFPMECSTEFIKTKDYLGDLEIVSGERMLKIRNSIETETEPLSISSKKFNIPINTLGNLLEYSKDKIERASSYIWEKGPVSWVSLHGCLPAQIKLDYNFGVFIGAYLAEGNTDHNSITITNYDKMFRENVKKWLIKNNISCKESSYDITINNSLLSKFLDINCGKGSTFKHVPSFAFNSNKEFIRGLISGYLSGDGDIECTNIMAWSVSKPLISGISLLLRSLGIFCYINENRMMYKNKDYYYFGITIPTKYFLQFSKEVDFIDTSKKEKINKLKSKLSKFRRDYMNSKFLCEENSVFWDFIVSFERVPYSGTVYDFQVDKNENFVLWNGLITHNTSMAWVIANELYGDNAKNCCLELNASDNRKIEDVREIIKKYARTGALVSVPYPFKLIILDECDSMTQDAQEALRRIMEEYIENVRFILCVNRVSKIIPAIISRCVPVSFAPLSKYFVVKRLSDICSEEKINADNGILEKIYEFSEGDLRKAINVLEASWNADKKNGRIEEETISELFGIPKKEDIDEMVKEAINGNFVESCKILDKVLYKDFVDAKLVVFSLLDHLKSNGSLDLIHELGNIELYDEKKAMELQITAFLASFCQKYKDKVESKELPDIFS